MQPNDCQTATVSNVSAQRISEAHFSAAADGLRQSIPWTARSGEPLIQTRDRDVRLALSHPHFGAGIGVLSSGARSAAGSAVHVVSNLAGPGRFGLDISGGLVTAHAQASILSGHAQTESFSLLSGLPATFRSGSAILIDFWNASEPYGTAETTVHSRVTKGQQLARWLEEAQQAGYAPTRGFIRLMGSISLEDTADKFRFHETNVDEIPPDRLGDAQ